MLLYRGKLLLTQDITLPALAEIIFMGSQRSAEGKGELQEAGAVWTDKGIWKDEESPQRNRLVDG